MESKADRQRNNVWSNKYFAISIGAMMVIFIVHHWLRVLHFKYGSKKPGNLIQCLTHIHRTTRNSLDSTILGLHVGRWLLYAVYWAINLILILTKVDLGNLNYVGKCLGWYSPSRVVSTLQANIYQEVANFAGAIAGLAMLMQNSPCKPGSYSFLWIPSVRLFEIHPFTMVSTDPTEFLIRVYDGFARELYGLAWKEPERALRCSIDGGYGQVPNFIAFDRIILLAGGSGASFTFAIALSVLQQAAAANTSKTIDFIWAVKHQEALNWFEIELTQLRESSNINVFIYVTREGISSGDATPQMMLQMSPHQPQWPFPILKRVFQRHQRLG
ncbi:NADPH oxidase family protein [Aspergillus affinis]|uniref:NADPH oxidase family protein n=1 Tax=Aspergillus affinis TaxID=1070780 RepID=UPI0022FE5BBE|nr:uncharacterized protein KD926_003720 [Aspergillus affinis]KAI9035330.1 hypothetical protein KD926_003720 [Aspergillus affinis]